MRAAVIVKSTYQSIETLDRKLRGSPLSRTLSTIFFVKNAIDIGIVAHQWYELQQDRAANMLSLEFYTLSQMLLDMKFRSDLYEKQIRQQQKLLDRVDRRR